jgi:hypothetical protein
MYCVTKMNFTEELILCSEEVSIPCSTSQLIPFGVIIVITLCSFARHFPQLDAGDSLQ